MLRVALPQPDGRMLWLQTTSNPVECCESAVTLTHHFTSDCLHNTMFKVFLFYILYNQIIKEQAEEGIQGV